MLVNNWKSVRKNGDLEKIFASVCRWYQSAWEKGCWMWMDCMKDRYEMKKRKKHVTQIFSLLQVNFYLLEKKAAGCEWIVWRTDTRYIKNMTKIFNLYYSRWIFICKHSSHRDIITHEHNVHFLWINIYSAN